MMSCLHALNRSKGTLTLDGSHRTALTDISHHEFPYWWNLQVGFSACTSTSRSIAAPPQKIGKRKSFGQRISRNGSAPPIMSRVKSRGASAAHSAPPAITRLTAWLHGCMVPSAQVRKQR